MQHWLDSLIVQRINSAILKHGRTHADLGELEKVAVLFRPPYLRDLFQTLAPRSPQEARRRALNIKLGRIDKIPLAKTGLFDERVELGDLAIFAIDQVASPDGRPLSTVQAHGVIAQAKVVRSSRRMREALVSAARVRDDTQRELKLLSAWPKFDLCEEGRLGVDQLEESK